MRKNHSMKTWAPEDIKSLRLRMGWSAAEFARFFGSLADLVMRWERGEASPSPDDILQFDRLSFHAESHSQAILREPLAELRLHELGREQIHSDTLADIGE